MNINTVILNLTLLIAQPHDLNLTKNNHIENLDSYGCHYSSTQSNYHCHKGPYKGQQFKNKEDFISQTQ